MEATCKRLPGGVHRRSRWGILARIAFPALSAMALAGCQNTVASSGVYYNAGLADASNEVLLANVIRAAKGYPTYYSAIGDYSGSVSTSSGPNLSADIPVDPLSNTSFSVSLGPSRSTQRNANASSLETQDFARAMYTSVAPELFTLLVGNRQGAGAVLAMSLLIEGFVVTRTEYDQVIGGALNACHSRYESLTRAHRGICEGFSETLARAECASIAGAGLAPGLVALRNDPTNRCEYDRFKAFAEAFMLNGPRLVQDASGGTVVMIGSGGGTARLFGHPGTGFRLRSPNEVVDYLGEAVAEAYREGWTPHLTSPDGQSIPIFVAHKGTGGGRAAVSAKIDGETYWISRHDIGGPQRDYSLQALALVKDFQALNTSQSQLPSATQIIVSGS